ncbi:MAG TPA: hypothetical protein VGJ59_18145 [Jatrophihabitantaceae bacterium]|jgi:hypothetical protein
MRQRYRRIVAAACCVGAIGVMAAVLLPGQGAGADRGGHSGSGHTKTHGPPPGHGSGNPDASGWASASVAARTASASASVPAPGHSAQPAAQPATPTVPASNTASAQAPAARTTVTLQGEQSRAPAPHQVTHANSPAAQIVEVAASPNRPARDSVALAVTIAGLLVATAIAVLYGSRPGPRQGRHRSAQPLGAHERR